MRDVDFLVVGGGIAGLRAAVGLAAGLKGEGRVLVVTKEGLAESNTAYAQGGIAVAMGGEKDVALHLEDTVVAGDGLVDREAAAVLVEQGPGRVEELLAWGTGFDRYEAGARAGRTVEAVRVEGVPWQRIAKAADEHGCDLVVVSASGASGLAQALVGEAAERVVRHAPCPVLVVR